MGMFKKLFRGKGRELEFAVRGDNDVKADDVVGASPVGKGRGVKIGLLLGGLLGVVVIVFAVRGFFFGGERLDFYKTVGAVFDMGGGEFHYEIDIKTGDLRSLIRYDSGGDVVDVGDLESLTGVVEEKKGEGDTKSLVSWDKHSSSVVVDWKNPSYKIILDGGVSREPYGLRMDVYLATELHNSKLTEIISVGDRTYLDVETLRGWLLSSRDKYLIGLGESLPNYSGKYLELKDSEVGFRGFGEADESLGIAGVRVLTEWYNRWFRGALGLFRVDGVHVEDGVARVGYAGESFRVVMGKVLRFVNNYGEAYRGVLDSMESDGVITGVQRLQMVRELDNRLFALSGLRGSLEQGLGDGYFGGVAREYTVDEVKVIEGVVALGYSGLDGRDVVLRLSGRRKAVSVGVEAPASGVISGLESGLGSVLGNFSEYLNITGVPLGYRLKPTAEGLLEKYLIGLRELSGERLPLGSFGEFVVSKYEEGTADGVYGEVEEVMRPYVVSAGESEGMNKGSDAEPAVDGGAGGLRYESGVVSIDFFVNTELSVDGVVVLDYEVINRGEEPVEYLADMFKVHGADSVVVSANSLSLLRALRPDFEEELESVLSVGGMSVVKGRLYFASQGGSLELYAGDVYVGKIN